MTLVIRILISALALLVTAYVLPGVEIDGLYIAIITALILGVINVTVKPLLLFFTLPITILTLGLFIFVINGLMLLFVASFIDGFSIDGFWWALLASVLVSGISALGNRFVK